jgi:hypothetical protein
VRVGCGGRKINNGHIKPKIRGGSLIFTANYSSKSKKDKHIECKGSSVLCFRPFSSNTEKEEIEGNKSSNKPLN